VHFFQGAGVRTVVLFFEKGSVWYFQFDPGRNLGKTHPLDDVDLAEFFERKPQRPIPRNTGASMSVP